jgi:SOS response regulatory protein OraA/RecX
MPTVEERKARSSSARRGSEPRQKPLEFALRRLARRSHGEQELAGKMVRAGYTPREIEETLDFLRTRRYLDDESFALSLARSSSERKLWGPGRIERKLRDLKLPSRDIESALREVFPDGETEAAAKALEKFLAKPRRDSGDRLRARAYRHLCARGFAPAVAYRLVSTGVFGDTEDSEPT